LTKPLVKIAKPVEGADLIIIDGPEQQVAYDWMSPIRAYLDDQPLSDDNACTYIIIIIGKVSSLDILVERSQMMLS
jgi:hypothetical protein